MGSAPIKGGRFIKRGTESSGFLCGPGHAQVFPVGSHWGIMLLYATAVWMYTHTHTYIHYIRLEYITLHYSTLNYSTLHRSTLHHSTLHYIHTYFIVYACVYTSFAFHELCETKLYICGGHALIQHFLGEGDHPSRVVPFFERIGFRREETGFFLVKDFSNVAYLIVKKHGLLENPLFTDVFPSYKPPFIGNFPAMVDDTGGYLFFCSQYWWHRPQAVLESQQQQYNNGAECSHAGFFGLLCRIVAMEEGGNEVWITVESNPGAYFQTRNWVESLQ